MRDRRTYIGGGDVAALLHLSKWRTPLDVYAAKVSETPVPDLDSPDIRRGVALEPLVLDILADAGADLARDFHVASPTLPYCAGTLDAVRKENGIPVAVVEVKCPRSHGYRKMLREGLPLDYVAQVQWYMWLTALPKAEVTLFCADEWEHTTLVVERDDEFIGMLRDAAERFWSDHVVPKVPPAEERDGRDGRDAALRTFIERGTDNGLIDRDGDAAFTAALQVYVEARDAKKEVEQVEKDAKERLLALLPSFGTYRCGPWSVKLTETKGRATIDSKLLREKYPSVAKDVEKVGAPGLSLTVRDISVTPNEKD